MTDQETVERAQRDGEIVLGPFDFDCRLCGRNFNYKATKKFHPMTFVAAHLKMCRLSRVPPKTS